MRVAIAFVVGVAIGWLLPRHPPAAPVPIIADTVVIVDTIRRPVPYPVVRTVTRYDTIRAQNSHANDSVPLPTIDTIPGDTIPSVIAPIERKVYETEDYRAEIEGYRPQLVGLEIYRKTPTITNTVTEKLRPRWALTAGPGIGYGLKGVQPYVGVSFGFVLWSK